MNKKIIVITLLALTICIYIYRKNMILQSHHKYSDVLYIEITQAMLGIDLFYKEKGNLPNAIEDLNQPNSQGQPYVSDDRQLDGYANRFLYSRTSIDTYDVTSSGLDGKFGTWDDVTVSKVGGLKKFDWAKFLLDF